MFDVLFHDKIDKKNRNNRKLCKDCTHSDGVGKQPHSPRLLNLWNLIELLSSMLPELFVFHHYNNTVYKYKIKTNKLIKELARFRYYYLSFKSKNCQLNL